MAPLGYCLPGKELVEKIGCLSLHLVVTIKTTVQGSPCFPRTTEQLYLLEKHREDDSFCLTVFCNAKLAAEHRYPQWPLCSALTWAGKLGHWQAAVLCSQVKN